MQKVAIIGSGISGLTCFHLLRNTHDITLFEKNSYIGGHSNTIDVNLTGVSIPVDTGFIVFNDRTYPNLCALLKQLKIETIKSNMSFGVSIDEGRIEYSTSSLSQFFSQSRNLASPSFLRMGLDILKFNRHSSKVKPETLKDLTLQDYLDRLSLSKVFRKDYLYPIAGSIWSTPLDHIRSYPASVFIKFFQNHGLVSIWDQPQWYTVKGGSRSYVTKIIQDHQNLVQLGDPVTTVIRTEEGVRLSTRAGSERHFDHVIFATPAHETLKILKEPTYQEETLLGAFGYSKNKVVVHSDIQFMPREKKAWSSWVYLKPGDHNGSGISLTYWMNNLQKFNAALPIFVTLNPHQAPSPSLTYAAFDYDHPLFDFKAIEAQTKLSTLNDSKVSFCGSYQRYGFHEDGIVSALQVVNHLGVHAPWQ